MKIVGTNTSTATWWSRLGFACTTTTRRLAVLRAHEGATDIRFIRAAASRFSLILGRTQYSSQALRSWASQRRELDRPWLEMYVPRMETEEGTFLLAQSETAVGGKKYKGKVDVRDSSPLYEKALVKGERSQTQN